MSSGEAATSLKLGDALHIVGGTIARVDEIWTTDAKLVSYYEDGLLTSVVVCLPYLEQLNIDHGAVRGVVSRERAAPGRSAPRVPGPSCAAGRPAGPRRSLRPGSPAAGKRKGLRLERARLQGRAALRGGGAPQVRARACPRTKARDFG